MNKNLQNTQEWLNEYVYGVDAHDIPELPFTQTDSLRAKNLVLLGEDAGTLAVLLGLKRNGGTLIVPLSEYTKPANELEVILPNSGLVACTWNARIFKQSEFSEINSIGLICDEDFEILTSHYLAFSQGASLYPHISKLTGAPSSQLKEEEQNLLIEYMYEEFIQLPEDIFTSLSPKLEKIFQESLEGEVIVEEELEEDDDDAIIFPGAMLKNLFLSPRLAASKKKENEDEDGENDDENEGEKDDDKK